MDLNEVASRLAMMDAKAEGKPLPVQAGADPEAVPAASAIGLVETPDPVEPQPAAAPEPEEEEGDSTLKSAVSGMEKRLKAAEREQDRWRKQADYWMNAFQTTQKAIPVAQPKAVEEESPEDYYPPKPKLSDFQDYDEFNEAVVDWKMAKRDIDAQLKQEKEEQQNYVGNIQNFIDNKMKQGMAQYPDTFWDAAQSVGERVSEDMRRAIFKSPNFPELVLGLSKNLPEVERIANVRDPDEQVYLIRSFADRLLVSNANLKSKESQQPPTVARPGVPANQTALHTQERKAMDKAIKTGDLRDWANVIGLREANPKVVSGA